MSDPTPVPVEATPEAEPCCLSLEPNPSTGQISPMACMICRLSCFGNPLQLLVMYCPNCYAHRQQQAVEEAAYLAGQKAVVEELSVSSRKVSLVKDLMQKVEWDKPSKIDAQLLPVYRQLMLYFQSQ